jgi:hypothetical protein
VRRQNEGKIRGQVLNYKFLVRIFPLKYILKEIVVLGGILYIKVNMGKN